MTYTIERCTKHTINGGEWEALPGAEYDELSEAMIELHALACDYQDLLRIGRKA